MPISGGGGGGGGSTLVTGGGVVGVGAADLQPMTPTTTRRIRQAHNTALFGLLFTKSPPYRK
jgi:hypothetical protein